MTTDTVKPADAELLRVTADDIRDLYCSLIGDERAARLRALAEVLEREEKERTEKTAQCWECGNPIRPFSKYTHGGPNSGA